MRWMQQLRMRTVMLFRRPNQSARLNQELEFHLEQQIAENTARGMSSQEARLAALRLFGNPTFFLRAPDVGDDARSRRCRQSP